YRLHAHAEGPVAAVMRGDTDVGGNLAAPELDQRVEGGAEAITILRMDAVEPSLDRATQRPPSLTEARRQLLGDADPVAFDVPVEDEVARPGQRQRAALDLTQRTDRSLSIGEGVLDRGETEQHDQQHQ